MAVTIASLLLAGGGWQPPAASAAGLPDDFLWGVSSSGFQSEGSSPDSNWSRHARTAAHDDVGRSVDFRHRYGDDIELARSLGVGVYRVGVEWARIEPRPGEIDWQEVAYYDDVVARIVAAGMRPMLTLDHWVYPGWAADRGGWSNPQMPQWWLRNARFVVDRYARYDPLWITINEPTYYVVQELRIGALDPLAAPAMADRLVTVHRSIYDHIHRRQPNALVTSNVPFIPTVQPVLDTVFIDRVRDKLDFVGIDYYYSVSAERADTHYAAIEESWRAPVAADGLYYALRHYARKLPGLPLYVVETGMPTRDGAPRPDGYRRADHLRDQIYWVQRARSDGIDVLGYNYWSLTDNYEWGSYTPRFGLYRVEAKTDPDLRRHPTDAVAAYREITAAGGVADTYRPTRPAEFCSLVDAPSSCTDPVR